MTEADLIIYSTLIVLALVVALLTWYGIKVRREAETAGRALSFERLRAAAGSRILPGPLLYGVWVGVNTMNERRMELKDRSGKLVTVLWFPTIPTDGVIEYFELDGKRYERINEGLLSGRTWLREARTGEVVLSAQHRALDVSIYRGKSDHELARLNAQSVMSELGELTRGNETIGQQFYVRSCQASVLSLRGSSLTLLEQCFVMLSVPRG